MPCVVLYLILMPLNSGFLDKDSVVPGLIDFNQKLVFSKLRFQNGLWGPRGVLLRDAEVLRWFSLF